MFLINSSQFTKFLYFEVFYNKIASGSVEFLGYLKVSSLEHPLVAAVVEVAVRTVALPNIMFFRWCTCLLVLFWLF